MFNYLIHPITKLKISLFSTEGKSLLKQYVRLVQIGGNLESCQQCNKHYNRLESGLADIKEQYGIGVPSDTTLKAYNFCMNCAEKLLKELKRYDSDSSTYKQIKENARKVIEKAEETDKKAKSKGINLAEFRRQGMKIRQEMGGSTVRSSVTRSNPRTIVNSTKCQHAIQIANNMLNNLNKREYFSVNFNDIYKLIMSNFKRDEIKIININPYYEEKYNTLLKELGVYMQSLKMRCSSPNRLQLINILKFFIETSDTDGGTDLPEFPTAPTFNPETPIDLKSLPIAPSKTPERPTEMMVNA